MANIFDLAKECGVSIATVSRALNGRGDVSENTRQHIQAAALRLGYRPHPTARGLKLKRTRTFGLIISSFHALESPIPSEILRGLGEAVEQGGYRLLMLSLWRGGDEFQDPVQALSEHQVDGVFLFEPSSLPSAAEAAKLNAPLVLVNAAGAGLPSVSSANYEGARLGVKHLRSLGHQAIGLLRGPEGNLAADDRWRGWRDALREDGIRPEAEWCETCPFTSFAQMSTATEEAAASRLLEGAPGLTAVLASSDLMALGLFRAAQARGIRIPQDLSVLGFDDTWAGRSCQPALSTLRQDPYRLGEEAARLLIQQLAAPGAVAKAGELVIPVKLALRQSTQGPRDGGKVS